jgi:hypothetical protein
MATRPGTPPNANELHNRNSETETKAEESVSKEEIN